MPGYDRSGPRGEGPMTGRQMGDCAPRPRQGVSPNAPAYYDYGTGYGRGLGRGPGFGRGPGRGPGRPFPGRGLGRVPR